MKLASLEKIISINDIKWAKSVQMVQVLGWNVVCRKNEYKPDDWAIFIPIDTEVDTNKEWFKFLRKKDSDKRWLKIETRRLCKVWSQGLLILPNTFPKVKELLENTCLSKHDDLVGIDVSEGLGVRKYEKDIMSKEEHSKLSKEGYKDFPEVISKTDELNLRSYPNILNELKNQKVLYISQKMDGTSMTLQGKEIEVLRLDILQEIANKVKYGKNPGEGIVIRPIIPVKSKITNGILSCKLINQKYKD